MCLIYVDIRIIYVYMQNRYANMRVKYAKHTIYWCWHATYLCWHELYKVKSLDECVHLQPIYVTMQSYSLAKCLVRFSHLPLAITKNESDTWLSKMPTRITVCYTLKLFSCMSHIYLACRHILLKNYLHTRGRSMLTYDLHHCYCSYCYYREKLALLITKGEIIYFIPSF